MFQPLDVIAIFLFPVTSVLADCLGPQMKLLSDDPRRTCTEIFASKNTIEYSCTSLIKGFPRAMIKYCPVELCLENGTWSKPSISCAMSECYEEGRSMEYVGHRMCTSSGRLCQRWDTQEPYRHRFRQDDMFPDYSVQLAEAFCRDPDGSKGAPWCFTTDPKKKWEFCGIKKCSDIIVLDGSCGQKKEQVQPPEEKDIDTGPDQSEEKYPLEKVADTLKQCTNGMKFNVEKDFRIMGKKILESEVRTVVECASLCTKMTSCRFFSYRRNNGACTLVEGNQYMVDKSQGYRAGVKLCHL